MMHYFLDKDGSRLHTHDKALMHPDPKGESSMSEVSNQTGAWDHAGVSRNPIDGSMASEKLTEYTSGHSFAYKVTGFTNLVLRRLVSGVRGE